MKKENQNMSRDEMIHFIGKPYALIISTIALLSIVSLFLSPIVAIWFGIIIGLKIGSSSLILAIIFSILKKAYIHAVEKFVDGEIEKLQTKSIPKSPFMQRIEEAMLKNKNKSMENSKKDRYDSSMFTPPFRLGKKQRRAVLDGNGLIVVLMEHKSEIQAQMYVDYLNGF